MHDHCSCSSLVTFHTATSHHLCLSHHLHLLLSTPLSTMPKAAVPPLTQKLGLGLRHSSQPLRPSSACFAFRGSPTHQQPNFSAFGLWAALLRDLKFGATVVLDGSKFGGGCSNCISSVGGGIGISIDYPGCRSAPTNCHISEFRGRRANSA